VGVTFSIITVLYSWRDEKMGNRAKLKKKEEEFHIPF